jgi:hypothetical protein
MENLEQDSCLKTPLGFRDISIMLREQRLDEIRKYDVIKDVVINREKEEIHNGERAKVYYFFLKEYNLYGRVFPLDELISADQVLDVIVQNWKPLYRSFNLDTQVYHDLYLGEELKVNISRKSPGMDPSFKIFNHIAGFIKDTGNGLYGRIDEGSRVLVEVFERDKGKKGDLIKVAPLRIL